MGRHRDKFAVSHRMRGELAPDEYFVLVPPRDPAAVSAVRAYAAATYDALLAADLIGWMDDLEGLQSVAPQDIEYRIALWTGVLATEVRKGNMEIETALQRIAGHAFDALKKE